MGVHVHLPRGAIPVLRRVLGVGRRSGTGGSPGVAYLDATTQYRIFHEFWTVRTLLLPREFLPELRRREIYELAASAPDAFGATAALVLAACGLWQSTHSTWRGGLIGSSVGS